MWPVRYFADEYWTEYYFSHGGATIVASEGGSMLLTGVGD